MRLPGLLIRKLQHPGLHVHALHLPPVPHQAVQPGHQVPGRLQRGAGGGQLQPGGLNGPKPGLLPDDPHILPPVGGGWRGVHDGNQIALVLRRPAHPVQGGHHVDLAALHVQGPEGPEQVRGVSRPKVLRGQGGHHVPDDRRGQDHGAQDAGLVQLQLSHLVPPQFFRRRGPRLGLSLTAAPQGEHGFPAVCNALP